MTTSRQGSRDTAIPRTQRNRVSRRAQKKREDTAQARTALRTEMIETPPPGAERLVHSVVQGARALTSKDGG